jgi:solute carrier family 25 folate transporter 32
MRMSDSNGSDHWGVHIVAAMTAGATGTIVTNPLWLIRTRFMVSILQDSSYGARPDTT